MNLKKLTVRFTYLVAGQYFGVVRRIDGPKALVITVGRSDDCGLNLRWDPLAEKCECTLYYRPDGYAVVNQHTMRNVVINGAPARRYGVLRSGEWFRVADSVFRFEVTASDDDRDGGRLMLEEGGLARVYESFKKVLRKLGIMKG